jgi:hypothetical protein
VLTRRRTEEVCGVKARALVVAVVGTMTFSAVSLAVPQTTAPTKRVTVLVEINDKGLTLHPFVGVGTESDLGQNLQVLVGPVPRGDYLSFNVYNHGKKPHDFTIFGKKTPPIKPGKAAHLFAAATVRGSFPYKSTLDKGKAFRGSMTIG